LQNFTSDTVKLIEQLNAWMFGSNSPVNCDPAEPPVPVEASN